MMGPRSVTPSLAPSQKHGQPITAVQVLDADESHTHNSPSVFASLALAATLMGVESQVIYSNNNNILQWREKLRGH